ncbi:MAG TPA: hypothetical protein ENH49_04430 [Candidatus Marinimicrobia bacterium]|nr:hypothetical protein [Candidatus Neomarinimicrobiota bacterium]
MKQVQEFDKQQFIIEECMLFSVQAGLQTRNKNYPIYAGKPLTEVQKRLKQQYDNRSNLKISLYDFLMEYLNDIKLNGIQEEHHCERIIELSNHISQKYNEILFNGRFRIGISQKIINLFLKYMWSMGEIPEPCHCPVDGIVKSQIERRFGRSKLIDWTKLDNLHDYLEYINVIQKIIIQEKISIAQWEFLNWGRR